MSCLTPDNERKFHSASRPEQEIIERLGLDCDAYLNLSENGSCTLDGGFSASDLRKIADELDRLSDSAAIVKEEK